MFPTGSYVYRRSCSCAPSLERVDASRVSRNVCGSYAYVVDTPFA